MDATLSTGTTVPHVDGARGCSFNEVTTEYAQGCPSDAGGGGTMRLRGRLPSMDYCSALSSFAFTSLVAIQRGLAQFPASATTVLTYESIRCRTCTPFFSRDLGEQYKRVLLVLRPA